MQFKVSLLIINLFIIIQVFGFNVRIVRQKDDVTNVTGIIKDTENRVNKNAYNESDSESVNTCGGIYTQPQFLIESPNYPSFYPNELDCTFIFRGPYCPSNYTLQFLDFNLDETKGCTGDRLMVGAKASLCGVEDGIKMFYTKTGTINLKFITAKHSSGRGFRILVSRSICISLIGSDDDDEDDGRTTTTTERITVIYPSSIVPNVYLPVDENIPPSKDHEGYPTFNITGKKHDPQNNSDSVNTCGGIYDDSQFLIETPNYPNDYPNDLNCLFIFKGPYCKTNYTLKILDFNVKDSLGCVDDRLEIKYKDALCGTHTGNKLYTSKTGTLELNFITNSDMSARGFRILVTRSACPIDVTPKPQPLPPTSIYITDPHNPDFSYTITPNTPSFFNPTTTPVNNLFTNPTPQLPNPPSRRYIPVTGTPSIKAPYAPSGQRPIGGDVLYPSNTKTATHITPYPPTDFNPTISKGQACCASTYSDKRFFIASPGFPYSHHKPTECVFTIYRANPKVCRLRMHFHYFWIGNQNINCEEGYLQIDGKLICGCQTGLNLVSPFDKHLGNTKVLRLKNFGVLRGQFNGFAIEIIQDECPKRYSPTDLSSTSFNYYNDQFNRISFPNSSALQRAPVTDNTEIFEPIDLGYKPRIVKHVYFFESPDYNDHVDTNFNLNKRREVEETTYFETTDLNPLYPQTNNNKCHMWGVFQLSMLHKDHLWDRMPKCNEIVNNPVMSSCKEYNFIKGYFQSPGYPYYYPKNLNTCYRFAKQRGFCGIRLVILDFDLEYSKDCRRDYLLFSNKFRYCSQALANTFTQFDVKNKNYEEIRFITDGINNGRGFRGVYEQIPCSGFMTPFPSIPLPTTPLPPIRPPVISTTSTTTKPSINVPCIREISDDYFTIDIYDFGKNVCNFNVKKSSVDVCRLELSFVTFNFPCDTEYLLVNNDKFCGQLQQQMVDFKFNNDEIPIIYHRLHQQITPGYGLKLHLVGRQISKDCDVKLPPAERISAVNVKIDNEGDFEIKQKSKSSRNVSVYLKRKYKEVCGIVMSVTASYLKDALCNIILNNKRNLECNPLSENTVYVPYNKTDKLELVFKNSEIVQDIQFKEVTCDNKFVV